MYKASYPPLSFSPSLPPFPPSLTHTQMEIVRNKSTETMSFPLTVLTTASWATYGTLIHDIYVQCHVYTGQCAVSVVGLGNF